jgi:hypothetical protein
LGVGEILLGVAFPLLVGTGVALAVLGDATAGEVLFARGCFLMAGADLLGLAFYRLYSDERLQEPWRLVLVAIAAFIITPSVFGSFLWIDTRAKRAASKAPEVLFDAQLQELNDLESFIGRKDEMELRILFDYPNMLRFNIALVTRSIAPQLVSPTESAEINTYNAAAKGMLDARFGRLIRPEKGALQFIGNPGEVFIVNVSDKYLANKAKLFSYESSAEMPPTVRDAVTEFDNTLQANTTSLFDVLNQNLKEDPNNVFHDTDQNSRYFAVTSSRYWSQFALLRPKADKVVNSIRAYLKTDK